MKESALLKQIQLAFTTVGARLFRNNTGHAWVGKTTVYQREAMVKVGPTDVVIRNARPFRAGLCVGSSDLIGWTTINVTQDMVGTKVAVFTAIEGKTGTLRTTKEQETFLNAVRGSGGFGGVARSADEAIELIKLWQVSE